MFEDDRLPDIADVSGNRVWTAVDSWAAALLGDARAELEMPDTTVERSNYLRGRIAVLKELRSLPADAERRRQRPVVGSRVNPSPF